jgi:glucose dehydrogenase
MNNPTQRRQHQTSFARSFANLFGAASVLLLLVAMHSPSLSAQGLDPKALLQKQPTDTWPTYNGDYSGKRFSPLDQINSDNVNQLTLAWIYRTHGQGIKATSLEVNAGFFLLFGDFCKRVVRQGFSGMLGRSDGIRAIVL